MNLSTSLGRKVRKCPYSVLCVLALCKRSNRIPRNLLELIGHFPKEPRQFVRLRLLDAVEEDLADALAALSDRGGVSLPYHGGENVISAHRASPAPRVESQVTLALVLFVEREDDVGLGLSDAFLDGSIPHRRGTALVLNPHVCLVLKRDRSGSETNARCEHRGGVRWGRSWTRGRE